MTARSKNAESKFSNEHLYYDDPAFDETAPRVYLLMESMDYDNKLAMDLRSKGIGVTTHFRPEHVLASYDRSRAGCILVLLEESSYRSAKELLTHLKSTITSRFLAAPIIVYISSPNLSAALSYLRYGANDIIGKFMREKSELTSVILKWLDKSNQIKDVLNAQYEARELFRQMPAPIQETAKLIYEGLSNQEIAQRVDRKLRTIENRRAMVMKLMQADSLVQLIQKLSRVLEKHADFI